MGWTKAGHLVNHMESALERLAAELGVATGYVDQGGHWRDVDRDVVRDVLAALGYPAHDEDEVVASLRKVMLHYWRRAVPPVVVAKQGSAARIRIHLPHGSPLRATLTLEGGDEGAAPVQVEHNVEPAQIDGALVGEAMIETGADLPLGWHLVRVTTVDGAHDCALVVTPARLPDPEHRGRGWGFATQLYSVRSTASWGTGDLGDLADLVEWSGGLGADHLIINPMHAAEPTLPRSDSPYLPTSRRFADPLYLRPEWIPEFDQLSRVDRDRVAQLHAVAVSAGSGELLDRNGSWAAKLSALKIIYSVRLSADRAGDFADFVTSGGDWLRDFATWCAIAVDRDDQPGPWPDAIANAASSGVAAARAALAQEVEFHQWLQWLLTEQSARTQQQARTAGMTIGVVRDLAVGVHPGGADAWCWPDLLMSGVSVGAPPDMYNQQGQDWSQPPWHPQRLADLAYRPFRDLVRGALDSSGGLRVDHVLGLFRLWCIPRGRPASEGTFVRYDAEALLGVLALEADRAGAVIIGEDLGTVEPGVATVLADLGVLGTTVLWFERWGAGQINAPEDWRGKSLASVTVHDLPPTLGYLAGEHVKLRDRLGLLERPASAEFAAAALEKQDWLAFARSRGLLASDNPTDVEFMIAMYRLLGESGAELVAIALADAVGERRAQNQPGTFLQYPNWRIPLADSSGRPVLLEQLAGLELPRLLIAAVTQRQS